MQSESNAAIFYTMIAELKQMSDLAEPTSFHRFLKALDEQGKLFRVYTQCVLSSFPPSSPLTPRRNIDGLEEKVGLSYGLGDKSLPVPSRRSTKPRTLPTPPASPRSPSKRSSPDPAEIPRCIPLHGHLSTLSCPACHETVSITPHLETLSTGSPIPCPECALIDGVRQAAGERSRGVGRMKPDVVLYGEAHKEGERVGEITRKDLLGARPDLLLVVGTSLKVPGTKLLVRELAKVIRPPRKEESEEEDFELPVASGSTSASGGGTSRKRKVKPPPVHSVYLNYDFPTPSREWKDVFDVWVRGDVQEFVEVLGAEQKEEEERVEVKRCEKEAAGKRKEERERVKEEKERVEAKESKGAKGKTVAKPKTKSAAGAGAVRKTAVKALKVVKAVKVVKEKVVKVTRSRPPPKDRVAAPPTSGRAGVSLLSFPVSKPGPTLRRK